MQYFFFINRTLDAKLLIYSDRVADGKEHKECNYYPPAFLPPMQVLETVHMTRTFVI